MITMNMRELFESVGGATLPPADTGQLADLVRQMRDRLGVEPPNAYMAFLRQTNGAMFNGLVIYGTRTITEEGEVVAPDIVNANELRRGYAPRFGNTLILGEVDDEFLLFRPGDSAAPEVFQAVDRLSGDAFLDAATFGELIATVIYELTGDEDDVDD
jgi:hypothetical protein